MNRLVEQTITTITHALLDDMVAGEFESNANTRRLEVAAYIKKFISEHPELADEFRRELKFHASKVCYIAETAIVCRGEPNELR